MVNSDNAPHLTLRFREWVESEWGKVDPFESTTDGIVLPSPILALENHELLGGLSFTSFTKPNSDTTGIWINTLYVAPEYRNRGIGAKLIEAAETESRKLAIEELFVFTDIPKLYERLGWDVVTSEEGSTVLKRLLSD